MRVALNGDEWQTSPPLSLFAQCWLVRSVGGPTNGSGNCGQEKKIPCRCWELNPDSSVSRPFPYSNRMREQRFSHARIVLLQIGQFIASAHDISKAERYQIWKQVSCPSLQSPSFTVCLYFIFLLSGHTSFVVVICHVCNMWVFW